MDSYGSILLQDIVAIITILNPIAAASIMIGMITPVTPSVIKPIALKATFTVIIASLITLFSGELIFKFFGINVLSLKVIGGIILMMIAINMVHGEHKKTRHSKEEHEEAQEKEDISIIPLGIPILFGPGLIATIMVLNNNHIKVMDATISYILISISIFIASLFVYLSLRYAGTIQKVLGVIGMKILTRIMGLIVGAIAAQFLVSGVKGLWSTM